MPSFYLPVIWSDSDLDNNLLLDGDEFHHLVNVSRYRVNDEIILTNGMGQLAYGKISKITKKNADIYISKIDSFQKGTPEIAVAFSLLKNKNDLWIIEKLTELGIKQFFPMETRYSVRRITDSKNKNHDPIQDKMIKTAISAIKQCDNAFLPIVHPVSTLNETILQIKNFGFKGIVASEKETETSLSELSFKLYPSSLCIFIGPEGGFHQDEFDLFMKEKIDSFTIGNHILRAETAAVTASAIVISSILQKVPKYY
jgi:16S rRNA (uracil1498-N3)-methyltransferase